MDADDMVRGDESVASAWNWLQALPSWQADAACRGQGPDAFFNERTEGDNALGSDAKAVCARCPVVAECLEYALDSWELYGIWGGCGEADRRAFRRVQRKRTHDDPRHVAGCSCAWCALLLINFRRLDGESIPLLSFSTASTHGRRATYNRGCRCPACKWSTRRVSELLARLGVDVVALWVENGEDPVTVEAAALPVLAGRVAAILAFMSGQPFADVERAGLEFLEGRFDDRVAKLNDLARAGDASKEETGTGRNMAA